MVNLFSSVVDFATTCKESKASVKRNTVQTSNGGI
jgi:hypothetical protein